MVSFPSVQLMLRLGVAEPLPASRMLIEALDSVEVTHNDEGRSGFQLVFRAGRSGLALVDSPVVAAPELAVFARVRILVVVSGVARVLMDGVITHQQYSPAPQPGASTFTVTGEDLSVLMDQTERQEPYAAQSIAMRVANILSRYSAYGVVPAVTPQGWDTPVIEQEKVPRQSGTDLAYLSALANAAGCVFYLIPGPLEGSSTAYFGPPVRNVAPQRALTWGMGSATNLTSISFEHEGTKPTLVDSQFPADPQPQEISTRTSTRVLLSAFPTLSTQVASIRTRLAPLGETDAAVASAKAQEVTNRSTDATVTASGEVDVIRYGAVLEARTIVSLRGVGFSYDGSWYVKSVSHSIKRGEYRQKFSLERDGLGALLPWVVP